MKCLRAITRGSFIGALLLCAFSARAEQKLTVTFTDRSVAFSGVTPGGRLVVFGVAREPLNTVPIIPAIVVRAEILADTDGDGVVRFELDVPVPRFGMWAAADLTSGAHAAFPTPGFEPRLIALVPDLLRNDNAGQLRKLEWPFGEIDLFVVRPGEGAWRFYASKASAVDENRDNGNRSLRIDIAEMIRIGDTAKGPRTFRNGDIVAIFDRREMQFGILEVGK
ncbi:MAG: hypothetical protein M3P06_19045 [Acidobacteriota bacterium]|nr:hypothetical protein [Acidobacteriota bacterium]